MSLNAEDDDDADDDANTEHEDLQDLTTNRNDDDANTEQDSHTNSDNDTANIELAGCLCLDF